jgi:hypothetical protein
MRQGILPPAFQLNLPNALTVLRILLVPVVVVAVGPASAARRDAER